MAQQVLPGTSSRSGMRQANSRVVMVGNPNVGKSVIFNALTGLNVDVSNYPGTTIDVSRGMLGGDELVDSPGVYGISSFNDEERITRAIVLDADIIVNVVSAISLDRDLFLTQQLIDMGKQLIVVLNQWDEALARGIEINIKHLSDLLSVPVLTCIAVRKEGIEKIIENLPVARTGRQSNMLKDLLRTFLEQGLDPARALLVLEGDESSATECSVEPGELRNDLYRQRRTEVNAIVSECVRQQGGKESLAVKAGRVLLHPVYGSVVACLVCFLFFYYMLGILVAGDLVDITEKRIMRGYYEPVIHKAAALVFPADVSVNGLRFTFPAGMLTAPEREAALQSALALLSPAEVNEKVRYDFWAYPGIWSVAGNVLAGEYGILTLTVTYLLGLLFPLVMAFYLGLSLMEDSGYLPRLAVLVDRLMNSIGLNGRAIIPLILGLGCVTMATITTRLLTTNREKLIATALLGVAIPCSAQLGVVSGVLAKTGGFLPWVFYGFIIASILALTGWLLNKILPGRSSGLILDLPPLRWPRADNVMKKTWKKTWNFLRESAPMFVLAGLVVSLAQVTGLLDLFVAAMHPLTVHLLHLPPDPRVATTFILGIVRRDFGAFGLTEVSMTAAQAVVAMVVITLFVPCIATVGVMIKERGLKVASVIWVGSWVAAFGVGTVLAYVLAPLFQLLGV